MTKQPLPWRLTFLCERFQMPTGKIKKIVHDKGFGFIQPQSGGDVFFHHTSVADGSFESMSEGQQVEFDVEQGGGKGGKGPRATSVRLVSS
jgi:CspA family cold shock protein